LDPAVITIPQVADFLNYLFEQKELSLSTIKGYRSAISRVLSKVNGIDISASPVIKDLITNFQVNRPFTERSLPRWDLNLVLDSLTRPPYEPLLSSSLSFLSRKTAFLLLLASGARRGEIHALEHKSIIKTQDAWFVKTDPKFVAKNCDPASGKRMFKGIKILKLPVEQGEINTLCPVRCLKWYLHKTSERRGAIAQLFITCNIKGTVTPIHKNTLTSWIKKVIADAHGAAGQESVSLVHRSVHEIRAVSSSYAAFGNVSLENILEQCRWASSTTFAKHYLRRVSGDSEGLKMLLPLQLAGALIKQ
jgi:integrase